MLFQNNINNITETDIINLIENKVSENKQLEYKSQLDKSDKSKHTLLKTICGFANTEGGLLIYGIREDEKNYPSEIVEIIGEDSFDKERNRLNSIITSKSEPPISNFEIKKLTVNQKNIILIKVPKSWNGPHRINFKQKCGEFFVRRSGKTEVMEFDELRNSFNLEKTLLTQINNFKEKRLTNIYLNKSMIPLNNGFKFIIHIIPFTLFSTKTYDLNIYEEDIQNLYKCDSNQYNFEGKILLNSSGYIQMFRNGIIEYVIAENENLKKIPIKQFINEGIEFINNSFKLYSKMNIFPPCIIFISLTNIKDCNIKLPNISLTTNKPLNPNKEILDPSGVVFNKYFDSNDDIGKQFKNTFDTIWNHFNMRKSYLFDENDNYKHP